MGSRSYKVSVPGSLMLFGEHAVLHNKSALVVAIDHYITINLTPRFDNKIKIISAGFPKFSIAINKFKVTKHYVYVLTAIQQELAKINQGFTLRINSDFPAAIGFGSSAAVTVATLAVLHLWLKGKPMARMKLYRQAVTVVHMVQGCGSGADVAASIFGGIIAYNRYPLAIKRINGTLPLVVIYSGKKVLTAEVVAQVEKRRKKFPKIFANLYRTIDNCTNTAISAIKNKHWARLGELMNIHQGLQDALGVNNAILSELIFSLRKCRGIYGAKISGSGLGDCVIGLGKIKNNIFPENRLQKKNGIRQIKVEIGF